MRESLDAGLSERYCKDILEPEIKHDFEVAFDDMIKMNIAYAVMLSKVDLISKEEAKIIISGLQEVQNSMTVDDVSGYLEDLYFNMERRMFSVIGAEVGGKLHTGRSRNDIHAVMARMEMRPSVLKILDLLLELLDLLIKKSKENIDTVITGYTHYQPGQPITLAHYYMSVFNALSRDFERIFNAYKTLNRSPYGAAAFAGSSFEIDRDILADLLGFDGIVENTLDCIASRDFVPELLAAYSILATNISRVAADMYFWATFENGMLEVGSEVACCSSIMPQKRNPVTLEASRSKAGYVIGGLTSALTVLKGAPFTNTVDTCSIDFAYFPAAEQMVHSIVCLLESIKYSSIRKDRAFESAKINLCTMTSLAEHLVKREKISFTQAHDIVGNIAAIVTENKSYIAGVSDVLLKEESQKVLGYEINMSQDEIDQVLDPIKNIETKVTVGGPSQIAVNNMINEAEKFFEAKVSAVASLKKTIEDADKDLQKEVAVINQ